MLRSIRHMELAVGTHYWPTWIYWACYSLHHRGDGAAGSTILAYSIIPASTDGPYQSSEDYGAGGDGGGWATPLLPPAPQDLLGTTGWMEQWVDNAGVTPLQADDSTTRQLGNGTTRESDARDSDAKIYCGCSGTGRVSFRGLLRGNLSVETSRYVSEWRCHYFNGRWIQTPKGK